VSGCRRWCTHSQTNSACLRLVVYGGRNKSSDIIHDSMLAASSLYYQLRPSLSVCIMRPVLQVYKTRAAFSTWYIWRACVTVYVLLGFVYAREIYPSFLPDPIRLWLVYAYQMLRTGRCPMMPVAVCGGFAVCEFAALKRPGAAC
jgi:hypothetical protein